MSFTELFRKAQERDEYWTEDAIISFTEQLHSLMKEQGISQSDLAAKIGVSQPYVAKILRGRDNFTIATMVKLVRAVGGRLQIAIGTTGAEAAPQQESVAATLAPGSAAAARESGAMAAKDQPEPTKASKQPRRGARRPVPRSLPDPQRRLP